MRITSHFTANQASRAIYLRKEFHGLTQGSSSITDYYARQKTTKDALCAIGHPVQELDLVLNTLRGLSADFRNAADIIAFTEPLPSFSKARNMLLTSKQSHNKGRPASSSSGSLFYATPSSNAPAPLPNGGRGRGKGSGGKPRGPPSGGAPPPNHADGPTPSTGPCVCMTPWGPLPVVVAPGFPTGGVASLPLRGMLLVAAVATPPPAS